MAPETPQTDAGRALFEQIQQVGLAHAMNGTVGVGIIAIEREAALAALRRLREAVADMTTIRDTAAMDIQDDVVDLIDAAIRAVKAR